MPFHLFVAAVLTMFPQDDGLNIRPLEPSSIGTQASFGDLAQALLEECHSVSLGSTCCFLHSSPVHPVADLPYITDLEYLASSVFSLSLCTHG
jgi:hypothetical protein